MDCARARELLQEELDARIAPEDAVLLSGHVAGCAACAAERRELASLRATFRAMPRAAAPPGFRDDVMQALPRRGRLRSLPRTLGWLVAAAAVVVVALTLTLREGRFAERETASARQSPAAATVSADDVRVPADPAPPEARAEKGETAKEEAGPGVGLIGLDEDETLAAGAASDRESGLADAAMRKSVAKAAAAPGVRYVVFRDAASARRFVDELVAADLPREGKEVEKDKKAEDDRGPDAGYVAPPKPTAKPAEPKGDVAKDGVRRDAAEDLTRATWRVIARTPLPARVAEPALAAMVVRSGGTLATSDEGERLRAVVDPPPPAATGPSTPGGGGPEEGNRAGGPPPAPPVVRREPAPEPAPPAERPTPRQPAAPPPTVVIVVLVEEPAPAGGKR